MSPVNVPHVMSFKDHSQVYKNFALSFQTKSGWEDLFSAYKYDQKADKVDFPIFDNISFIGPSTSRGPPRGPNNFVVPKNHFNVHKMVKLELPNHFGSV